MSVSRVGGASSPALSASPGSCRGRDRNGSNAASFVFAYSSGSL